MTVNSQQMTCSIIKNVVSLVIVIGICTAREGLTRPIQDWSYDKMSKEADIVVIATPVAQQYTGKETHLPRIRRDNERIKVLGLETTFEISVCFSGDVAQKDRSTIVLYHYRFKNPKTNRNVPMAAQLLRLNPEKEAQYLMFLKQTDNGRYVPVSGQVDPAYAVEKLQQKKSQF